MIEKPNRTVFITGCSSGIGRAVAELLAERNYNVVATARNPETLDSLIEAAEKRGHRLIGVACDVADEGSRVSALMAAHEAFGDIHILINNAGFGIAGPIEAVPLDYARRQFEVNTFGPMRLMQMIVPDMRRAGWGRIINVSSVLGRMAAPFNGWYSASKFALEALTETLRFELTRFGIKSASILPGPVKTSFIANVQIPEFLSPAEKNYHPVMDRMYAQRESRRKYEVSAERCARVVVRAVEATHPRPRYYVTFPAHVSAWSKRLLSDRMIERMTRTVYGMNSAESATKTESA